ncbi:MAG: PQQ-binding-like beta-propeller repeat protein [Polyangiaceae bacterium]
MPNPSTDFRVARVFLHPAWVLALALLLVNDHILKAALPGVLTGKLSDLAGMFVAPPVLALLLRVRDRRGLAWCHVAVGLGFSAINLSPATARTVEALSTVLVRWQIWCDPTDLIALPLLVVSHCLGSRAAQRRRLAEIRTLWSAAAERGVFALALLGCIATSRAPPARVSAGPTRVYVPLGYDSQRLALVDSATGRDAGQLSTALASSPRPALVDGVLVGWETYGGEGRGRLVGVDVATGTRGFVIEGTSAPWRSAVLAVGDRAVVVRRLSDPSGGTRSGGVLSSWDVTTGRAAWDRPLEQPDQVVLHARERLLLLAEAERVTRVDPETGQTEWTITVDEDVIAMTSLADRVYLQLADDHLVALDAASGTERQRLAYPSRPWVSRHVFDGSLVASDRSLFLLADDDQVLVLDPQLRRRRVVTDVVGLYAEQGVVLALHGDAISRLDDLSGAPRWRYGEADFWFDSPTVAAGAIYLGGDEQVVAVDAETGRERWRWHHPEDG